MKRDELMEVIYSLAGSKGFYNRLANSLAYMKEHDTEMYNNILTAWEDMNFTDSVDFIMYLEG